MLCSKRLFLGATLASVLGIFVQPTSTQAMGDKGEAPDLSQGTVLVAGATGQTGRRIIAQLKGTGFTVLAMTRNLTRAQELLGEDYNWIVADVTDEASLARAMDGVDLVISAIGSRKSDPTTSTETIDYGGNKNLVDAAKAAGIQHFVLMSSGGVTSGPEAFLNVNFNNLLIWKFKSEEYLRNSGLSYTVVRPGGLREIHDSGTGLLLTQGDLGLGGEITYEDIASVLIECLANPDARNKTFEVINFKTAKPDEWATQLRRLAAD